MPWSETSAMDQKWLFIRDYVRGSFEKRLMSRNGGFTWASKRVPLSHLLEGQHIGLEEVGDGIWDVYFSHVRLGQMDERLLKVEDALGSREEGETQSCKGCPRTKVLTMCPAVQCHDA